jgi:hypothetical protein
MKKVILIVSFLAIFASCDKIDELTKVDFEATLTEEFFVSMDGNSQSFFENINLVLANNADIAPYINKIENIEILSASYKLKNHQGDQTASGNATVIGTDGITFGPFTHQFFQDAQNQTVFPLAGVSQLGDLANELKTTKMLNLNFSGLQDQATDNSFVVEVTFVLKVTADAL